MSSGAQEAELERPYSVTTALRRKWLLAGLVGLTSLALDRLTKYLVVSFVDMGDQVRLLPFLSLERTANRGVAFGLLTGRQVFIIAGVVVSLVVVILYIRFDPRRVLPGWAGGLVLGGSMGNLVDRLAQGHVTDFLKLPHWPNFNLADVFIFTGIGLVALSLLLPAGEPVKRS